MCTPSKKPRESQPCGFADFPKQYIDPDSISELNILEKPFTKINFERLSEFLDYLDFPAMTLPRGTILCHSAHPKDFYDKDKGVNLNTIYWWNEYFPGQSSYKGGWFTYKTSYGGPNFGLNLYYKLQDDLTLPFIPNDFSSKFFRADPRYFSEKSRLANKKNLIDKIIGSIKNRQELVQNIDNLLDIISPTDKEMEIQEMLLNFKLNFVNGRFDPNISLENYVWDLIDELHILRNGYSGEMYLKYRGTNDVLDYYADVYSGSHILEGVKDWEKKGYLSLDHPSGSYADNLAIKLADLGFNGYISCDECEVYITHAAMQRVLTKPFTFDLAPEKIRTDEVVDLTQLINASFEFPQIPLVTTKVSARYNIPSNHIPLTEFLTYLQNPEKFI